MRVASALVLSLALAAPSLGAVFYEGFDYEAGDLHLNVNPSVGTTWYSSASSGTADRVQVATPGLVKPPDTLNETGNMAQFGANGRTDRISLGTNYTSANSTTVFYSALLRVTDLGGTLSTGATFFGFNNTPQTSLNDDTAAQPSAISGRLIIKPDGAGYQLCISKASGSLGDFVFTDGTPYNLGDTLVVVGRYTFNTVNTLDDTFDLWVNPDVSTYADDGLIPTPLKTQSSGSDGGQIATIILRQASAVVPAELQMDEIRVARTWAEVTPTPEPASLGLLGLAAMLGLRRRR
jgi:hypothetical protein